MLHAFFKNGVKLAVRKSKATDNLGQRTRSQHVSRCIFTYSRCTWACFSGNGRLSIIHLDRPLDGACVRTSTAFPVVHVAFQPVNAQKLAAGSIVRS